jgi:purine-binding chemotaxis protein CheW
MAPQTAESLQFSDRPSSEDSNVLAGDQFVTFSCDSRNFGIDIMAVREIRSWSPVTEVPDQPRAVRGVLDIRGEVVQVFDLNLLLDRVANKVSSSNVVIIVSVADKSIGILVDAVSDIISVGTKDMRPAPPGGAGGSGVVSGMAKHKDTLFSILNLAPLLRG